MDPEKVLDILHDAVSPAAEFVHQPAGSILDAFPNPLQDTGANLNCNVWQ